MWQYFHFDKRFWDKFGDTILANVFTPTIFYHYFNRQARRAVIAANYWKEDEDMLQDIIVANDLKLGSDYKTAKKIMAWLNATYPSFAYYTFDARETWNRPRETIQSFEERKAGKPRTYTTDCDDYAILIYSLCRVAGIPAENLRLCFMKTTSEWHLNVMYLDKGKTPYALEGTYRPTIAISEFGRTPYMQLKHNGIFYYEHLWILFNENGAWKHKYYIKD